MSFRFYKTVLISFLFSFSTSAADLTQVFSELRDSAENYEINGAVCEQVARLELAQQFPFPQFEIVTGIVYADKQRVIGELDVVVFRSTDRRAVLVGEVKCWQNLHSAHKKAMAQRERFLSTLKTRTDIKFYQSSGRATGFELGQFEGLTQFVSISQQGGAVAGFDLDLNFELDELMRLREMLINCQRRGECPKAR